MRRFAFAALVVSLLAACPKGTEEPSPTLSRVEVTPTAPSLLAGTHTQFQATAVYSDGATADVTGSASWSSSASSVLSVSDAAGSRGLAQALTGGSATVTATVGGVSGSTTASVVVKTVASLAVAPATLNLPAGQESNLSATATFDDSTTLDVTGSAAWSSGGPAVTVSDAMGSKGRVHAVSEGGATITAAFGGQSGQGVVTVTPAELLSVRVEPLAPTLPVGGALDLKAFGLFTDATELDLSTLATWTPAQPGVVSLAASGAAMRATGLAEGSVVVTVAYQGKSAPVTITVRPAVLQSIAISPAAPATIVGGTVQLQATGSYDNGQVLDVTSLALWSTSASGVATVSNAAATRGLLTGVAVGSAEVTASIGGVGDTVTAQVTNLTAATLRIDPGVATVAPAHTVSLRAFGVDATGGQVELTGVVTWASSATGVATVSGGVVTGVQAGTSAITATYGPKAATANVKVEAPWPTALRISTGATASGGVGVEGKLNAYATYSDGQSRVVTDLASWTSDSPAVVAVSDMAGTKGEVTYAGVGTAHVTVAFAELSAVVTITVTPRTARWLLISTAPAPLPVGVTHALKAEALFDDWSTEDVTALADWSAAGAVTVDAAGVATTVSAGAGVVTASYAGVSSSTLVTVVGVAPSRLILSLSKSSILEGDTTLWTARLEYPSSITYDVTDECTLTTDDPLVADVIPAWDFVAPHGVGAGTTSVTASYAGITGTAPLTVTAVVGLTLNVPSVLTVGSREFATLQSGYADFGQEASWSSSNTAVLTVTNSAGTPGKGWVTAVGTGTATISATYVSATAGTLTRSATVTVRPRILSIAVSPPFAQLVEDDYMGALDRRQFAAVATLADGTTLDVTARANWWTADSWVAVADWAVQGLITARGPGTTTVTATLDGVGGAALVDVVSDGYTSLDFYPLGGLRLPPGVTVPMTVGGTNYTWYGFGLPPAAGVSWSSSDAAVASFSTVPGHEGELTTVASGTATLSAQFGGRTATATLVVAPIVGLVASPPAPSLKAATSRTFTVRATFSCAPLPCTAPTADVTDWVEPWTTTDPLVAWTTLEREYMVPGSTTTLWAGRTGTATLSTSFGGVPLDVPVTVTTPVVQSISISGLTAAGCYVGTTTPVRVLATLDNGTSVDVTELATLSVPTGGSFGALIGSPPALEAIAVGTGTLRADWSGKTVTLGFTVVDTGPNALDINPGSRSVPSGATFLAQIRAYTYSSPGSHVGTEATVTTSDATVAEAVNRSDGLEIRAKAPGTAVVTASYRGLQAFAVVSVYAPTGRFWTSFGYASGPMHVRERRALLGQEGGWSTADVSSATTWSVANPAVATLAEPSVLEAVASGSTTVTATFGGQTDDLAVTVLAATLDAVDVEPRAVALPIGAVEQLQMAGVYSDGAWIPISHAATWWVADPAVADFDPARPGLLEAKAARITWVEARCDGKVAAMPVTVF